MSDEHSTQETNEDSIIKIKKQIQEGIKNNYIDENILNQISKYKEANPEELKRLSKVFGNVLEPPTTANTGS